MAKATPEMIQMVNDIMAACCERNARKIQALCVDDENGGFYCVHSGGEVNKYLDDCIKSLRFKPPAHALDCKTEGYYDGNCGWFFTVFDGEFPDGTPEIIRGTTVLRKVNDEWKVASVHVSEAVPRPERFKLS